MKKACVIMTAVAVGLSSPGNFVFAGDKAKGSCPVEPSRATPTATSVLEASLDPVEHATRLLEELAKERRANMAASDRLSKDGSSVEQKLQELYAEQGRISRDLQILHCHIGRGCYPFCLNGVQICNRETAVRRTSTLMARSLALQAASNLLERNLQDGQNETDQIIACIDSLEASIVLVPYLTSRIMVQHLPTDSVSMMETLTAMLPKESDAIAAHRVRVAAFLAGPLPGESQTAETPAPADAVPQ